MNTDTALSQNPETLLAQCNAAAAAGDSEATDRLWREFIRLLWHPMRATVPWVVPPRDSEVQL